MTIDEAIKHAEEVAKKQENNAKSYPRPDKNVKGSGRKYNAYLKCAEEHRQLAEWLKDYKRLLEQEPFPKGHGRLIILSEDAVKREQIPLGFSCQNWISEVGLSNATVAIIEADKVESEVKE